MAIKRNTKKPKARIDKWTIDLAHGKPTLLGTVSGHQSEYLNNKLTRTSTIEKIDFVKGIAETKHTIYVLGN